MVAAKRKGEEVMPRLESRSNSGRHFSLPSSPFFSPNASNEQFPFQVRIQAWKLLFSLITGNTSGRKLHCRLNENPTICMIVKWAMNHAGGHCPCTSCFIVSKTVCRPEEQTVQAVSQLNIKWRSRNAPVQSPSLANTHFHYYLTAFRMSNFFHHFT